MNCAVSTAQLSRRGTINLLPVAMDAFGNALGNAVGVAITPKPPDPAADVKKLSAVQQLIRAMGGPAPEQGSLDDRAQAKVEELKAIDHLSDEDARKLAPVLMRIDEDPELREQLNWGSARGLAAVKAEVQANPVGNEVLGKRLAAGMSPADALMDAYEASLMSAMVGKVDAMDAVITASKAAGEKVDPQYLALRNARVAALLSKDVYYDQSVSGLLPQAVTQEGKDFNHNGENQSGLFGRVYFDKTTETHFVAFRGTEMDVPGKAYADWKENALQALGRSSAQYEEAKDIGRQIVKAHPDENVTFVGHSLGGGLASAAAVETGRSGITFNAAGLHRNTAAYVPERDDWNIKAYYVEGEALASLQAHPRSAFALLGPGIQLAGELLNAAPQAAGERIGLEPVQQRGMDQNFAAGRAFALHGMGQAALALDRLVGLREHQLLPRKY